MFSTFSVHHFLKNQQTMTDQKIKEFKKKIIFQCSSKQERNAVLILCNIMS